MKKTLLILAKLLVSIGLIAWLLSFMDLAALQAQFRQIGPVWLVLPPLMILGQSAISTWKWHTILRVDGESHSFWLLYKTYLIGAFIGLFLFSLVGQDVYRVMALKSANERLRSSVSSVLFDRATGLFAMTTIAVLAYQYFPGQQYGLLALLTYFAAIGVFLLCTGTAVSDFIGGLAWTPMHKLAALLSAFRAYRQHLPLLLAILLLSLLFQFNVVVINKYYNFVLDINIEFTTLLVIVPLIFFTDMLPVSINGIGVRDSAFVFFFVAVGHTAEEGFAVSVMVLASRYVANLVGGALLLHSMLQRKPAARAEQ